MKKLPEPEIYRLEMQFMPWGELMRYVAATVAKKIPFGGSLLDLMCGPGYLLDLIHAQRPDLSLTGVDLDGEYIRYGSSTNPRVRYMQADVRTWLDLKRYDCVLCTGGVHHLPYADQPQLFTKMAAMLKDDGFGICADSCVGEYANEWERKLGALELGHGYLQEVLNSKAPSFIITAAVDILHNDVLADGEYKNSLSRLVEMAEEAFDWIDVRRIWPIIGSDQWGDHILILRK
jgi:trans-aconitate methyltransferase